MATGETCLSDIMGCWAPDLEGKRMKPPSPNVPLGIGVQGSQLPVGSDPCALCSSLREADRYK